MNYFLNLPVWKKLASAFLIVGLIPMIIIGAEAILVSNNIITYQVGNKLEAVRTIKANEVKRYFERVRNQIRTLSENPVVIDAASRLPSAYNNYRQELNISDAQLEKQKASVIRYYQEMFGEEFKKINGTAVDTATMYEKLDKDSWALQYAYISNNKHPLGAKDTLDFANDNSTYSAIHKMVHPTLRNFLQRFGYYDIFIADPSTGDIIYSVFKELDYTTSLKNGPYAVTSIGTAFNKALKFNDSESTVLVDFSTYLPSYNAPASFMASPIYNGKEKVGILIFQMPIEDMTVIMSERAGMGETGESYLIGDDYLMRSDSHFDAEHHNVISSFKHPEKGSAKTESAMRALNGESGSEIVNDFNGKQVLSAYMPVDLGDITWAIISEQDVTEAFSPITSLRNKIIIVSIICVIAVSLIAYFFSQLLSKPIRRVMEAIKKSNETGLFNNKVNYTNKDEIGQMAISFDNFVSSLSNMFNETNSVLKDVSKENYESRINNVYHGDMYQLSNGINETIHTINQAKIDQEKQNQVIISASKDAAKKAEESEIAAQKASEAAREANRVRQALDVAGPPVMMVDSDNRILYTNHALNHIISLISNSIRQSQKASDSKNIIGQTLDIFSGSRSGRMLSQKMNSDNKTELHIENRIFILQSTPIQDGNELIGQVIEWNDRTNETQIESEIDSMIQAAFNGDFSVQLNTSNKSGFFLSLAQGLNQLTSRTRSVINDVNSVVQNMSQGDLTKKIESDYTGTFGELKDSINITMDKLVNVVNHISDAANQVNVGAREIEAGITDLSARTEEQASSLEETAASMNEMTSTVANSAENAKNADLLSKDAEKKASDGGDIVQQAIDSMQSINAASKRIADIIGVIDEIAFQTNLLALNAAVEAARAGEQGRGFAVVASEVRNLAQRSSHAAKEIKDLIIDSVDKVDTGTRLVNLSGETLQDIVSSIENVSQIISDLSLAAKEQTTGIQQVNSAITSMDGVTQQNSALVEQATSASENMAAQATKMAEAVSFFRTK